MEIEDRDPNPPEAYEPLNLRCEECGEPCTEDDYAWDGLLYHLDCAPVTDCAEILRANLHEGAVKEAHRIFRDLAADAERKLEMWEFNRRISQRLAARDAFARAKVEQANGGGEGDR